MATQINTPELMTLEQAGEYTSTSLRFMRRLVSERRIPVTRLGRHVRIQRQVLDAWIEQSTQPALDRRV
jgi:excisionase family DNA binding protein